MEALRKRNERGGLMVKHILFWALKPEHKQEVREIVTELNRNFQNMIPCIKGLQKAEAGVNYNGGTYDFALYTEFTDREAEAAYQVHPEHLKIKEYLKAVTVGKACVDYFAD